MTEYYLYEEPRWNYSRAMDLVLHDGNPVIIGRLADSDYPVEWNRVLFMREYCLSGDSTVWNFTYEAVCDTMHLDDDGYGILHYVEYGTIQDRFLGVGYTRVDLQEPIWLDDPSGLAVILGDHGTTVCPVHEWNDDDWVNVAAWNAVYIGDHGAENDVYAACGWYMLDEGVGNPSNPYGFVEVATENSSVALILDESLVEYGWAEILYDSANNLLVTGGFQGNQAQDEMKHNMFLGAVDLGSLTLTSTAAHASGLAFKYLDGPLLLMDDGVYVYIGNTTNMYTEATGIDVTLWTWNDRLEEFVFEDNRTFLNGSGDVFENYSEVSAFAAAYHTVGLNEYVQIMLNAIDDQNEDCLLAATVFLETGTMEIDSMVIDEVFTFEEDLSTWVTMAFGFVFTGLSPVEGIGCGQTSSPCFTSSRTMLFQIKDDRKDSRNRPLDKSVIETQEGYHEILLGNRSCCTRLVDVRRNHSLTGSGTYSRRKSHGGSVRQF